MPSLFRRAVKPAARSPQWRALATLVTLLLLLSYLMLRYWRVVPDLPSLLDHPYFPGGTDNGIPGYCANELEAMGEPSLWKLSRRGRGAAYRFLCVPSFSRSYAVRVTKSHDGAELRMVELVDESGSRTNQVKAERKFSLSLGQWADLDALAEKAGFWGMPAADVSVICDGAALVVEGVRDGRYLGVHRQSPPPGPYRRLCLYLLALAGPGHPNLDEDHEPLSVGLGHFAVVRARTLALAVRFVEHTHIGRGGSDYGGATYEWILQTDGSGDFSRGNVVGGKGRVLGAPNYRPEEMAMVCGPLTLEWGPCYTDRDYLSVRRAECKIDQSDVIGIADSDWIHLSNVDIDNKYLLWSYGHRGSGGR